MNRYPQDTTTLNQFSTKIINTQLAELLIQPDSELKVRRVDSKDAGGKTPIYELLPDADHVQSFTYPLIHEVDNEPRVFVDVRPYTRSDRAGNVTVNALSDYKFLVYYGLLTHAWMNEGHLAFRNYSEIPGKAYVTWLSNVITRNLNLDMVLQVELKAALGQFFEAQFVDEDEKDSPRLKQRLTIGASKYSYSNPVTTAEILENIEITYNIKDFIESLKSLNPRFESLTLTNLYAMVNRSWFGANAPVTSCTAIEYPPAIYAMTYFALNHRGYNKTAIGNIVYKDRNSRESKFFTTSINKIIEDSAV